MSVFKVVARDPKTGRQFSKKVYITEASFNRYSPDLIKRWRHYDDIEVYEMKGEEFILQYKLLKPRNKEEVKMFQIDYGYNNAWYEQYIKNHL